jgi:hypothetical protein
LIRKDGVKVTYTNVLDAPVAPVKSVAIREEMFRQLSPQSRPASGDPFQLFKLACGTDTYHEEPTQGRLNLRLQCYASYAVVNWGFRLAPTLQSTVVGAVSEDGMTYFLNGSFGGKNAPHTVDANYILHGTMKPVDINQHGHIDFQDTYKWRNSIAGTTVLVVAGSANLV